MLKFTAVKSGPHTGPSQSVSSVEVSNENPIGVISRDKKGSVVFRTTASSGTGGAEQIALTTDEVKELASEMEKAESLLAM